MPAGVSRLANEHRGLILVTGATGSGKTTTLAAMLDHINRTRSQHIVTIEDPIEILHSDHSSIVNQREVGLDTESFGQALRRVLRQDPGHDPDRRAARRRDRADRAPGGRVRPPRLLDPAHDRRRRERRPDDRVLPARQAAADPLRPRRRAPRRDQPAAAAAARRRARRRRRGDGDERAHLRPDPRAAHRGDRGRGRGGRLLRHADLRAGPDRARPRREGRARGRSQRRHERARLRGRARPRAQGADGRGRPGRGGGQQPRRRTTTFLLFASSVTRTPDAPARRGRARSSSRSGRDPHRPTRSPSSPRTQLRRPRRSCCRAPRCRTRPARSCCRPGAWEAPFLPVRELSYEELQQLWLRAGAVYGIPWQVLAAINKIESNFGRNMGPSSAGAVGWMQFMPDTWLRWGTDGNGDGLADPWSPDDGVFSAARYLAAAERPNRHLARDLRLQPCAVVRRRRAPAGRDVRRRARGRRRRLLARPDGDRARGRAGAGGGALRAARRRRGARGRVGVEGGTPRRRRGRPRAARLRPGTRAEGRVPGRAGAGCGLGRDRPGCAPSSSRRRPRSRRAQSGAHAASFTPAAADVLRMPTRADGYVFPVGGGPTRRLGRPCPSRLPGRRHRRAAGRAALCARRRARALGRRRRPLRHRPRAPDARRARVGLLPPLLPRPGTRCRGRF